MAGLGSALHKFKPNSHALPCSGTDFILDERRYLYGFVTEYIHNVTFWDRVFGRLRADL
jgi:hypothetical protein